jgi:hypothetical protein
MRSLIFADGDEMRRSKELLVDTALATDISGKKRSAMRKLRWQRAFRPWRSPYQGLEEGGRDPVDACRRGLGVAVVLEQIVQASDVAHTIQHWETFTMWNE